jgi:hypothetical protein
MRNDIITRDPSIPRPPKQPDAVKRRVEAALAANEESKKRARK